MGMLNEGNIVVVMFEDDRYLKFIQGAFTNVLISGVQVQLEPKDEDSLKFDYILFCIVAAPGIDRLAKWIKDSGGEALMPHFV